MVSRTCILQLKIFDINFSRVMTKFADINIITGTNASTAASIFESVDKLFSTNNIMLDDSVGLGRDNTNADIGNHNSINRKVKLRDVTYSEIAFSEVG